MPANLPVPMPGGFNPATLFKPLTSPTSQRIVCAGWGQPKVGKTHFALTFPDPIRLLDLDMGAEDLAHKFPGKTIIHAPLAPQDPTDPASVARALELFIHAWIWALGEASKDGGTVIMDTASQLWRWVQVVKLEQIRQKRYHAEVAKKGGNESLVDYDNVRLYQYDYAEANNVMANLLRRPLQAEGANVVLLHHAQEKYDSSGNATGKYQMRGFAETTAIVPITLQFFRDQAGAFAAQIQHFRPDGLREGLVLQNMAYPLLHKLAHP